MKSFSSGIVVLLALAVSSVLSAGPRFAPYYDVNLDDPKPSLTYTISQTNQKAFVLAFALGSHAGCVPAWGAMDPIDAEHILGPIKEAQKQGVEFIIATGGAVGPYLEHLCGTVETLAQAYRTVLDVVGTNHIDVDVEAPVTNDIMNKALAMVQRERPEVTVSFTLMVQGDDYGLVDSIGTIVLKNAKENGVRVDVVNAMAMEYPTSLDWGDSVIATANSVLKQMKVIWPEKSDTELKKMLGITPMLGRNMSGKVFELRHAQQLVNWANQNHIGFLGFWSVGRDNGDCPGGGVSPHCSSVAQEEFEFIRIFQGFNG